MEQWYYVDEGGQQAGPVAREELERLGREGTLRPEQLVWRAGQADWMAAAQVPGLLPAAGGVEAPPLPPPMAVPLAYASPEDRKTARILRNARQNCIMLFVIFALSVLVVLGTVAWHVLAPVPAPGVVMPFGCIIYAGMFGAIFAAIYLPVRWRYIMRLRAGYKWLGLIGGFGLIAILLLSLAAVAIAALVA